MNDKPAESESRAVAAPRPNLSNLQPMLDTDRFEHFQRASKALMHSSILNESIRGNSPEQCFSNLMLVFDLSDRWKLPALSIAQGIAIVHNKVVYEGKLIQAMLEASLGVRLHYHWTGERGSLEYRVYASDQPWDDLTLEDLERLQPGVTIRGRRMVDGSVGEWRTFQKDQRTANPAWTGRATQNQLAYRAAREWARLYEPAQMLGVYGDDEIDAYAMRTSIRDVTEPAAAPVGLSAAMTRPAEPIDAEVEPLEGDDGSKQAPDAPETAQDGQDAPAGPSDAPKPKAKPQAKPKGEDLEKRQADEKAAAEFGFKSAIGGEDLDKLLAEEKERRADELQLAAVRRGFAEGQEAMNDLAVEAEEAGYVGDELNDMLADATTDHEKRVIENAYARGQAKRAQDNADEDHQKALELQAERGSGPDSDDSLEAVREAEPDLVETTEADAAQDAEDKSMSDTGADEGGAIEAWRRKLPDLANWKEIKSSLNALHKTDAWGNATAEQIAGIRADAWRAEARLIEAGRDRMDFLNDLTAFRCWVESTTDTDAITGNWQTLVTMKIYQDLAQENRQSLERAVMGRMRELQGARKV